MDQSSNDELAAYQHHIAKLISTVAAKSGVPGICLELVANGSRVSACAGVLATDSATQMSGSARFEIGGISKALLSLVILDMAAAEKLSIDQPIAILLPEFNGTEFGDRVLLRHLLSHSGGYQSVSFADVEVRRDYSWDKLVAFLCSTPFLFEPGTVFSYSLTAPAVLAEVIRRVTGLPAMQAARERLLNRLSMNIGSSASDRELPDINVISHGRDPSTNKLIRAASLQLCEFWTQSLFDFTFSIPDLTTLFDALMDSRDSDVAAPLVSRQTAELSQKQELLIPFSTGGVVSERLPMSVGLGSAEFLPGWFGYNGPFAGQSVSVRYHADQKVVLAIGTNAHAPFLCDAIIYEVLRSLVGELKKPEPTIDDNMPTPQELAGDYLGSSGGRIALMPQGQDVVCEMISGLPRSPKIRILMKADERKRWVVRSDPGTLSLGIFRDPTTGTPSAMVGATAYRKKLQD